MESAQRFEAVDAPTGKCSYTILILPRHHTGSRWFEVDIYPPPKWKESRPVRLLFLFHNLYLLGFHGGKEKWKFFDDAEMDGIRLEDVELYIDLLGFNGGYNVIGQSYDSFNIGYLGQLLTYSTLVGFSERTDDVMLKGALCRVVVTISEALRFLNLMELLIKVFETGQTVRCLDVVVKSTEAHKNISYHFTKWDVYCSVIRSGKAAYDANKLAGFPEFRSFFSFIGVLLPVDD
ncbi:hypothetical protein QOZ80_4BG0332960 [Eleusine coracana subsp. coracana]|nr:hypothetical protein QOZ80_4BG0332960 [Eleusine coracana subsp. coracana]